jgi:endonuclease III-like uncharacterized protein
MANRPAANLDERAALLVDLFTALMAVNQWTLDRAFSVVSRLKSEGLLDLPALAGMTLEDVNERLRHAGYDRGDFMAMQMVERILYLGRALESGGIEKVETLGVSGRFNELREVLLTLKGVGPTVVNSFFALRGVSEPGD